MNSQGLATPKHITMPSEHSHAASLCVFPDGSSPKGSAETHCYNPEQFRKAYGIDKLHQRGLTGKGQTIIFADSFGSPTLQKDLDHFSEAYNLPKTAIEFIYPNGEFVNTLTSADEVGWAQETTLDAQWAHAIAPDAKLVNIVTNIAETTGMTGMEDLFKGIDMAIAKYPHAIVSMSFGTGEATFGSADVTKFLQGSLHTTLQNATTAGFTLLASAGDSGSAEIGADEKSLLPFATASYPASDPLITAVGGTSLQSDWLWAPQGTIDEYWNCKLSGLGKCPKDYLLSTKTNSITESVWNESWTLAAGGGGISTVFKAPAYQASLNHDVQKLVNGQRGIPDVSLNAAINGGVNVYTSFVSPSQGVKAASWQAYGGTSCSAPQTAGLVALAGEAASNQLGKQVGIGSLNPILYSLPDHDFNDIVSVKFGTDTVIENNTMYFSKALLAVQGPTHVPPVAVPGYTTTTGYDLATGLGTPRAEAFVLDVAAARVAQGN